MISLHCFRISPGVISALHEKPPPIQGGGATESPFSPAGDNIRESRGFSSRPYVSFQVVTVTNHCYVKSGEMCTKSGLHRQMSAHHFSTLPMHIFFVGIITAHCSRRTKKKHLSCASSEGFYLRQLMLGGSQQQSRTGHYVTAAQSAHNRTHTGQEVC